MLDLLSSAASALLGGGATGLLGVGLSKFFEWRHTKLEFEQKVKMRELDIRSMETEAKLQIERVKAESEAAQDVADAQAFGKSFEHDRAAYVTGELTPAQRWLMVVVDFARGMIRPSETVFYTAFVVYIFWRILDIVGGLGEALSPEKAVGMLQDIIETVLYLATTVTVWWFGVRPARRGDGR